MRLIALTAISGAEAMFDGFIETQTSTANAIVKSFPITGFNSVTILNTYGLEASLLVDGVTQTVSLIRDSIKDWWDYFFAPVRTGRDVVFYFPTQTSGNATITISYPGGTAKCGMCVTGLATERMKTRWGIKIGITDYSKIVTDGSGTYLNPGNWAKRATASLLTNEGNLDLAYREIVENRATPCVFDYNSYEQGLTERHTSEDEVQALVVYGYTEDFTASPVYNNFSTAEHEIQGLI